MMIEKGSATAVVAGSVTAAGSGAAKYLGFTHDEWAVIGVIGGLVVAVIGVIVNTGVNFWFKSQHLKLAKQALRADPSE